MNNSNNKSTLNHLLTHITSVSSPVPITDNVIPSYSVAKEYDLPGLLDKKTYEELEDAGKWTSGVNSYIGDIYFNIGKVGIGTTQPGESLHVDGAITIGDADNNVVGTLKWDGYNFQGRKSGGWVNLDNLSFTNTDYFLSSVAFVGDDLKFTMGGGGTNITLSSFLGGTVSKGDHSHGTDYLIGLGTGVILKSSFDAAGFLKRKTYVNNIGTYESDPRTFLTDEDNNTILHSEFSSNGFMKFSHDTTTDTYTYSIDNRTFFTDILIYPGDFIVPPATNPVAGFMKRNASVGDYEVDTRTLYLDNYIYNSSFDEAGFMTTNGNKSYDVVDSTFLTTSAFNDLALLRSLFNINNPPDSGFLGRVISSGNEIFSVSTTTYLDDETFTSDDHDVLLAAIPHLVLVSSSGGDWGTESTAARSNHNHDSTYVTGNDWNTNSTNTLILRNSHIDSTHLDFEDTGGDWGEDDTAAISNHVDHETTYLTSLPTGDDTLIVQSTHTHIGLAGTGSSTTHAARSDHDHGTAYITPAYLAAEYMSITKHNNEDLPNSNHCVDDAYNDTKIENLFTAGVIKGKVTSGVVTSIQNQYQIDRAQINWLNPPWSDGEPLLKSAELKEFEDYPYGHNHIDFRDSNHCVGAAYNDTLIIAAVQTTEMEAIIDNYTIDAGTVNEKTVLTAVPSSPVPVFTDRFPSSLELDDKTLIMKMSDISPTTGQPVETAPHPEYDFTSLSEDGVVEGVSYNGVSAGGTTGTIRLSMSDESAYSAHTTSLNGCPDFSNYTDNYLNKYSGTVWKQILWTEINSLDDTGNYTESPPVYPGVQGYQYSGYTSSNIGIPYSGDGTFTHTHTIADIIGLGGTKSWVVAGFNAIILLRDSYSDIRYKENIVDVEENYLGIIDDIKVFRYDWNSWMINNTMVKNINGRSNLGVSAQDLEEKIPEIVRETISDVKGINKSGMFAFMIKLIQELKKKNDDLDHNLETIADQLGLAI
jgi:hypothetical protein